MCKACCATRADCPGFIGDHSSAATPPHQQAAPVAAGGSVAGAGVGPLGPPAASVGGLAGTAVGGVKDPVGAYSAWSLLGSSDVERLLSYSSSMEAWLELASSLGGARKQ